MVRQYLTICVSLICLVVYGAGNPAKAGFHPSLDLPNIAGWSLATVALSTAAHYIYKNSPAERVNGYEENLGPGEWYLGAYTGVSYLPSSDWKMSTNFGPTFQSRTAKNIVYQPGVLGGIKFGRYFDNYPWFGVEVETNFSRNNIRGDQGRISPPVPGGPTNALGGADRFMIWDTQFNLLVRCGFLKDKEIPFGRLQPYMGIGPGFELIYGKFDSAKNFAIEAQSGVRYMCTQKIGIFVEYKFSYQFEVEYQNFLIAKRNDLTPPGGGTMVFDVPHHRFVVGISYHFKNLYGN